MSPSKMFRATKYVDPRLLPHVPLVTAEKEHDPAIANSKNNPMPKKHILYLYYKLSKYCQRQISEASRAAQKWREHAGKKC